MPFIRLGTALRAAITGICSDVNWRCLCRSYLNATAGYKGVPAHQQLFRQLDRHQNQRLLRYRSHLKAKHHFHSDLNGPYLPRLKVEENVYLEHQM